MYRIIPQTRGAVPMPATDSRAYTRLRSLLTELFQFEKADLDFGIYRIMNQRRNDIANFLDHDLLPAVRTALGAYQAVERQALEAELEDLRGQLVKLQVDPETN